MSASTSRTTSQSRELCRHFSLAEVKSATNNFDDELVIGKGGFGKVYKGYIDDGATIVATKRLNQASKQGAQEFWNEVKMLSELRHTHLVVLIGYCNDYDEMIIVYEYMANGSLADHLYKNCKEIDGIGLTWDQRLNICIGAARGLDYLHTGTEKCFIHRDVKTTNILLDETWVAKVSDLGLLKGTTSHSATHVSTAVRGSFGYFDPDYFLTRRLTKKSDVYAYGVVMLEVLCGRPAVDTTLEEDQISLVSWAQQCIKKGKLHRIIDQSVKGHVSPHVLKYFVELTFKCLHNHPNRRPTMDEVVGKLELIMESHHTERTSRKITKFIDSFTFVTKPMKHWWKARKDQGVISRSSRDLHQQLSSQAIKQFRHFSLNEILLATNNFSEYHTIGRGHSGQVYRGFIDLKAVAIKRFQVKTSERPVEEFIATTQAHSQLQHINVVSLVGVCCDGQELALVYDYMENGPLHDHLHGQGNQPIPWDMRLQICIDVARGLDYLHAGANQKFVHRNVTSSNILLDQNWSAKVSGLGCVVMLPTETAYEDDIDDVMGTFGYLDPEYFHSGRVRKSLDMFSFGVVLLEVLCAKKPIDLQQRTFLAHMIRSSIESEAIDEIIDPYLIGKIAPDSLKEFIDIAVTCTHLDGDERPPMDDVLGSLRSALWLQQTWQDRIYTGA